MSSPSVPIPEKSQYNAPFLFFFSVASSSSRSQLGLCDELLFNVVFSVLAVPCYPVKAKLWPSMLKKERESLVVVKLASQAMKSPHLKAMAL